MLEVDVFCRWIDECQRINQPAGYEESGAPKKEGLGFTSAPKTAAKTNNGSNGMKATTRAFSSSDEDDDSIDISSSSEDEDEEEKSESDHKPIAPTKKGPSFGKKRLRQDNAESGDEEAHETKRLKIDATPAPIKPIITTTTSKPEEPDSGEDSELF